MPYFMWKWREENEKQKYDKSGYYDVLHVPYVIVAFIFWVSDNQPHLKKKRSGDVGLEQKYLPTLES